MIACSCTRHLLAPTAPRLLGDESWYCGVLSITCDYRSEHALTYQFPVTYLILSNRTYSTPRSEARVTHPTAGDQRGGERHTRQGDQRGGERHTRQGDQLFACQAASGLCCSSDTTTRSASRNAVAGRCGGVAVPVGVAPE